MTASLIFEDRPVDADTLLARGSALAGGLRRMGVQEGDVIGVLMRNAPAYIDVMHACRIAGCHFCPINWHFTPAEVEFLMRDSGAKVLIGHRDLVDAVEPLLPSHVQLLRVDAEGGGHHGACLLQVGVELVQRHGLAHHALGPAGGA